MSAEHDLEILTDAVEVEPTLGSQPRVPFAIGALLLAGLLVGVLGIVVLTGVSSVAPDESVVCGGESSCTGLSLGQVRELTGIDLASAGEVVESSYAATDSTVTVTARVRLPEAGPDPFAGTAYEPITTPTEQWPTDDLGVIAYYAIAGTGGSNTAEAVYAVDDYMREIVLVVVHRDLE